MLQQCFTWTLKVFSESLCYRLDLQKSSPDQIISLASKCLEMNLLLPVKGMTKHIGFKMEAMINLGSTNVE